MKSKVDKLDVDKLATVPVDLSKLCDLVNDVVKKTEYNELVKKVKNISSTDTSNLVKKISEIENKISEIYYYLKI